MAGTISDWVIEMENKGLGSLAKAFHSEKVEDQKRLRKSGLPVYADFQTTYAEFNSDNIELTQFLRRYSKVVIRALPNTRKFPRRYKIGVAGFENCKEFLEREVLPENAGLYRVLLSEWQPDKRSGIIISRLDSVIAEVSDAGLDAFSHGAEPTAGCLIDFWKVGHRENKTTWRGKENERSLILRALDAIELSRDSFNPYYRRGYFEFLETQKGELKFLDYKINKAYLR
ncbi:hypothetical protein ACFL0X_00355 [Nanoarchaeota archaeon]